MLLRIQRCSPPRVADEHGDEVVARSPLELMWAVAGGQPVEAVWPMDNREQSQVRSIVSSYWPHATVDFRGVATGPS